MTDSYIALDLETTGLEPKKEKITEIAALKVEHGQITGRFVTLVNPKRPLTERVVELTGITDDMLKDAPVIEDIIGEVLEFIGNLPLLGHNIRFDYSFLKQAAVNQKMEFECEAVDTLKVCRKLMPEQEKKNLQEMADDHTMVETSEGTFEWTQEMTDQSIAEYEQTLKDIKNGLLVSKSVDGDTECMTTFNPNWVGSTTD